MKLEIVYGMKQHNVLLQNKGLRPLVIYELKLHFSKTPLDFLAQ